jgi:hypothetical protein
MPQPGMGTEAVATTPIPCRFRRVRLKGKVSSNGSTKTLEGESRAYGSPRDRKRLTVSGASRHNRGDLPRLHYGPSLSLPEPGQQSRKFSSGLRRTAAAGSGQV